MSKILLVNGSPNEFGCTYTALTELKGKLEEHGIETELLQIGKKPVSGCIACGGCRSGGKCVIDDSVNYVIERLDKYDGIVLGAPVYYAGPSAQICAFADRLFHSNGGRMSGKLGAALVSCRRAGSTAALDRLNKYFTISNMVIVGSQYWNMVHGFTPEQVLEDEEGMQTMRALGENMAWLLKCIEAAKAAGVPAPQYEKRLMTNFIR